MGKGSQPRPFSVDKETFNANWDKAFGKNRKEKDDERSRNEKLSNTSETSKKK